MGKQAESAGAEDPTGVAGPQPRDTPAAVAAREAASGVWLQVTVLRAPGRGPAPGYRANAPPSCRSWRPGYSTQCRPSSRRTFLALIPSPWTLRRPRGRQTLHPRVPIWRRRCWTRPPCFSATTTTRKAGVQQEGSKPRPESPRSSAG